MQKEAFSGTPGPETTGRSNIYAIAIPSAAEIRMDNALGHEITQLL
jgi:hypothetical protein